MKVYTVKSIDTGIIKKIESENINTLRLRLEIDHGSLGLSQYDKVDDENRFIYLPNKGYQFKITFQILKVETVKKKGGQPGNTNAKKDAENKVKSLFGLRLSKVQDIELRKRVKDSGLSNNEYFLKHMRL